RGDRDDRPRRFDRDAPRGAPRGDRDDRPRSFDRDSRPPRSFDRDSRPPRSFDRDSRPPRGDRDDRPRRFDRDAPRGAPRGDRDDRPRSFDRDSRPPRSFDRDSRPPRGDRDDRPRRFDRDAPRGAPRGDRDDRPRSFDRDSRFSRGDRDDRPRRFDRDSRPPRSAAQERSDEVKGRIGERRTSGEMSTPPERSREDWVDEGSVRPARKAPSFGPRSKGTGRPQKGGRKEVRALDSVVDQFEKALGSKASPRALKRYDAALQAFEAHRYDDARKILNPMSREYSEVAAVREMLGLCLYRGGQWKRALVEFEASLKLNPDWIFNHAVIADCHRALGEHQMVEKYWQELQEASPHPELMAEGRIVMAGSMADRRQITEALALMDKASGDMNRPSEYHLRQWFVIADLYDKEGNVIKARQFFERIAAIDPGFVDVAERLSTLGA
ncbi:MAG: tetratricopeptide repeat protein, partial [Actinobacteria bacterium]|nr:tetratricopeptide repeat protein [Actinomycetota bacterium]